MSLLIVGLNHQTAPLAVRECFAFSKENVPKLLRQFNEAEIVLLSTCNRMEIISNVEHSDALIKTLCTIFQLDQQSLKNHWYVYHEVAAMEHLVRVTSGLDSMILGEPQIFGQVKTAYEIAQQAGTVGKTLNQIFQHVFSLSKKVRSETTIGKNSISVAYTAVNLAKHIFSDLANCRVLVLGAGEAAKLAAKHFAEHHVKVFYFVSRTLENAMALAHQYHGEGFELNELPMLLSKVDIILTAIENQASLISYEMLQQSIKESMKPLLLLDLSVPRNIAPTIASLPDCYLYTIDDLQAIVQQGFTQRRDAANIANKIIEIEVEQFFRKQKVSAHATEIEHFTCQVENLIAEFTKVAEKNGYCEVEMKEAKKLAKQIHHQALVFLDKTISGE